MPRHHAALWLIVGALAGTGCSSPAPTAPTPAAAAAPIPTVVAVPSGIAVSGKVYDTAYRPLSFAIVEVLDGPQAGTKVTADSLGQFGLRGAFDETTRFRATKAGHADGVARMLPFCAQCNPQHWMYFYLGLPEAPADIAGNYTLTVMADNSCGTLPDEMRSRTYTARVVAAPNQPTAVDTWFNVSIGGASFVPGPGLASLWVVVAGDYVEVSAGDLHGQPGLLEAIDAQTYFSLGGLGTTNLGSSGASTITTSFDGEIIFCVLKAGQAPLDGTGRYTCGPDRAVTRAACTSRKHQLLFTRR